VHVVGHRTRIRHADVGGDHRAAEAVRHEVAVVHAGATDDPGRAVFQAPDDEGVLHRRHHQRRVRLDETNAGAVRRHDLVASAGGCGRVLALEQQHAWRAFAAAHQPQRRAMARNHSDSGVVGGEDLVEAEAQILQEEGKGRRQFLAGQHDFRRLDVLPDLVHGSS